MNRYWPNIVSWILVSATAVAGIMGFVVGRFWPLTAALAALSATVHLCGPRHSQHAILGAMSMITAFLVCLAPGGNLVSACVTSCTAFALLIGSRAMTRPLVMRLDPPVGLRALLMSSGTFGASSLVLLGPRIDFDWPVVLWKAPSLVLVATLAGILAQLCATPWLVKLIPGSRPDERPAVALWVLLVLLLSGYAASHYGLVTFTR